MKTDLKVIEVSGRKVIYSIDKFSKEHVLSLLEHGGPIISNKDYDVAMESFKKALKLTLAVYMLSKFAKMKESGASDEEIKKEWKNVMRL